MALNAQESYNVLVSQVHVPVFFAKLAEYGIEPASQEEAVNMLKMAGKLRNLHEYEAVKTASQRVDQTALINQELDQLLASRFGVQTNDDVSYKEAAANALTNPTILEAARAWNAYQASQSNT